MIPLDIPQAALHIVHMSDRDTTDQQETLPAEVRPKVDWDSPQWPKARYLTTAEAAERLSCGERWVRQLCSQGTLRAEKWGRDYLIPSEALQEYKKVSK